MRLCARIRGAREEWDSNPRMSCPINGFQDRRLRPLGHPPGRSVVARHRPGGLPCRDECRGYRGACGRFGDLRRPLPAMVETVPAVTYVLPFGHADERYLYVSPQSEAVLGLTHAEMMVGVARADPADPSRRSWAHRAGHRRARRGRWDEEYRLVLPDGTTRWVHDQTRSGPGERRPAGHVVRRHHPARTSARRRRVARRRRGALPSVGRTAPRGRLHRHVRGEARSRSSSAGRSRRSRATHRKPGSPTRSSGSRSIHPDDRDHMRRDWPLKLDGAEEWADEYKIVHRDGRVLWVRDVARLVHSADGTPLFWQGVMLDVTLQHQAEDERLRSEARYRTLVEQVPGIVYIDTNEPDPAPMYVSPQVLELTGYTVDEWMTDRGLWLNAAHPDDRERLRKEWVSAVGRRAPFSIEYRSVHRDGRVSWFHDSARLVRSDDGMPLFWQGLIQDITRREARRGDDERVRAAPPDARRAGPRDRVHRLARRIADLLLRQPAVHGDARVPSRGVPERPDAVLPDHPSGRPGSRRRRVGRGGSAQRLVLLRFPPVPSRRRDACSSAKPRS